MNSRWPPNSTALMALREGHLLLFRVQNIDNDTLTDQQSKFLDLLNVGLRRSPLTTIARPSTNLLSASALNV